ncbi:hypothetical protein GCM10027445_02980 [Amycolatopsis endophytica]|uniref:Uncharacterized protein n=1 Tax=Amycolatopsis endophytica TaxID=860233 RepID=A0A853B9B5_9PSEU|nr:hypothetical protein [Amycolatopsis endophytica]NYI91364.1 hypothetical protein [Amycolatopsis endophytica]
MTCASRISSARTRCRRCHWSRCCCSWRRGGSRACGPASRGPGWWWSPGFGYAGVVALVTWQALRGQPLIHPDARTLLALGALVAAVAAGAAWSLSGSARQKVSVS